MRIKFFVIKLPLLGMVRNKGLEPLRHKTSDPKSDASAIPPIPQKQEFPRSTVSS